MHGIIAESANTVLLGRVPVMATKFCSPVSEPAISIDSDKITGSSAKKAKITGSSAKKAKIALTCSLKRCDHPQGEIVPQQHCHVEIKAALPVSSFPQDTAVSWGKEGEAVLHEDCWSRLLKDTRRRNPKKAVIHISPVEKKLVREAAKTVEKHDSIEDLQRASSRIVRLLKRARHCVVFTGAGISTSAGIGDYRGKEGKWTEMDREAITQEAVSSSGSDNDEGVAYEDLRPTYTHEALVKLLEMGRVHFIISQNGDGLHGLSGVPSQALAELHGNVFLELCEKCGHRYYRPYYVMDDVASQYYEELQDHGHTQLRKPKRALECEQCGLNHRTGRRCEVKGCNGFLKDSIINFGDDLEEGILRGAEEQAKQADLMLSLGTTMRVTPACDLVVMGREPLRLVIVNRQHTGFDDECARKGEDGEVLGVRLFGDCDVVMKEVMELLLTPQEIEEWEGLREGKKEDYRRLRTN
jgi:mono-ADP-ribosyltransferase sirtuin 6